MTNAQNPCKTAAEVVLAFGGTAKTAKLLGVKMPTVSMWKKRQAIPGQWHMRILREAEARGIPLDDCVFGL